MGTAQGLRARKDGARKHRTAALAAILLGAACAAAPASAQLAASQSASVGGQTGAGSAFELTFWQSVTGSNDCAQYQAYLDTYPAGTFGPLARAKMAAIGGCLAAPRPLAAVAAPAPAPVATPLSPATAPAFAVAPAGPVQAAPVAALVAPAAPAAAVASAPTVSPAVSAAVTGAADPAKPAAASLAERLARASQVFAGGQQAGPALPAEPSFVAVSEPVPPARFCSTEDRNTFHDRRFVPAQQQAMENNRIAGAHMQELRHFYDAVAANHDVPAMNASAEAAIAFDPVARRYFDDSARYQALFQQIMATPVGNCDKAERRAQEDSSKDETHA